MHSRGRKKEGCTGSQGSCWASSLFSETTRREVIPKEEETEVPRVASLLVPQQSPVITSAVDPVSGAERGRLVSTFTEKTSQGGRQAVNGERNANVECNKASRQRDVWYPPNMECTCRLRMERGKGSDHRANGPLTPACRDFPGFSTGILTCQELLGRRLEASRPEIQTHIL